MFQLQENRTKQAERNTSVAVQICSFPYTNLGALYPGKPQTDWNIPGL